LRESVTEDYSVEVLPSQRRQAVLRRLTALGEVGFAELAEEFGVSEMTIRRDVESLEGEGLARRVRGGAISVTSRSYEPPFAIRATTAAEAKTAIGAAAARLVNDGDTIIVDVGTTTLELARALHGRRGVTVVTPALPVAVELGNDPDIRVVVTGGQVRQGELSLTGGMAEDAFTAMNCDLAFIGVAGVCAVPGLTEYNPDDARVKRAAIAAARRTIVLADSSKLGRIAFATVAPLSAVDALVTDAPAGNVTLREIAAAGTDVIGADVIGADVIGAGPTSAGERQRPA
jgi:DeoR/GlpR family transcriptional regulator of sugar metabolism